MPVQTLNINQFSAGWIPNDDQLNGRKNGLIQMDNVELDENGALSLVGGTTVTASYADTAHTLYSRYLNGTLINYLALANGAIYRNSTSIATGGDSVKGAFATAFNFTLAASGTKRIKDNGTTAVNLGILPPSAKPGIVSATISNAPYCLIGTPNSDTVDAYGSSGVSGGKLQLTTDSDGIVAVQTYLAVNPTKDATKLTGVGGDVGYQLDSDLIIVNGYTSQDPGFVSFQFDVLLDIPDSSGTQVANYYSYYLSNLNDLNYNPITGLFTLSIRRDQFIRVGASVYGWDSVYGFRITATGPASTQIMDVWAYTTSSPFVIQGGSNSQSGTYQYVQVNVNNTGSYIAKSSIGPISDVVRISANQALITPQDPTGVDAQCNEAWIYRRSVDGGLLDQFYRVKVFTTAGTYAQAYDKVGDQDALTADITINLNLVSAASTGIADKFLEIVGPIEGRWFYFTAYFMYPSDINNPDQIDVSKGVRLTGSNSEVFLWARKVADSVVLVGTSQDIYIISGTFVTQPDNTVDIYYKGLGCKYPPISYDVDIYNGTAYYMASDGWRSFSLDLSNPLLVSPNTDRLYRGDSINTPFSSPQYQPVSLAVAPGAGRFPVTVAKNKLWCFVRGTGRLEVYDFIRNYWRNTFYGVGDATVAFAAPNGTVIAAFQDQKLRVVDVRTNKLIDGTTQQTVGITFPVMDNGTPLQRKDPYTLKFRGYTGATGSLSIGISDENGSIVSPTAPFQSSVSDTEKIYDISQYYPTPIKTFQIKLSGQVADLSLSAIAIEHDLRPPQITFLRVLANNFGSVARKRIYNIPFQIDTLGNDVEVIDRADGVNQTALTVNSSTKKSFSYDYTRNNSNDITRAVDHEFTFDGNGDVFEFYGFQDLAPEDVEVYPTPNYTYVIPVTNLGIAHKKRIRVWPFELDTITGTVIFIPIVDGVLVTSQTTTFGPNLIRDDIKTVFHFFTEDVFGVDYSGIFYSSTPFELRKIHQPDVVQVLPIARRFDQVGPDEFFRYGRVKKVELRVLPYGSVIPVKLYGNDNQISDLTFNVTAGKEASYYIGTDKGTGTEIVRIELGPTAFDFHRYYIRLQVMKSGQETDLEWITLPAPAEK